MQRIILGILCASLLIVAVSYLPWSGPKIVITKPVISFPELGQPQKLPGGIDFYTVTSTDNSGRKLWIYLPEHRSGTMLPCVFIAPAGSPCITGMSLAEGDQPEHLPYAQAGYAVVAYDLDGPLKSGASNKEFMQAVTKFRCVEGGVVNGQAAIDYALAKIPDIDSQHLYSAGHSSAATVSLLLAEKDPRIKACIAYAPEFDIIAFISENTMAYCRKKMPDFRQYLSDISPASHLKQLTCPTFIFRAEDDDNINWIIFDTETTRLRRQNPLTKYVTVPIGGHYDSMIDYGIPRAIGWLQQLPQ